MRGRQLQPGSDDTEHLASGCVRIVAGSLVHGPHRHVPHACGPSRALDLGPFFAERESVLRPNLDAAASDFDLESRVTAAHEIQRTLDLLNGSLAVPLVQLCLRRGET